MTPLSKKLIWGIVGSVTASALAALVIWGVPYQIKHHVNSAEAYEVAMQTKTDFYEYRVYQEQRDLKHQKAKRPLSEYERDRLEYLERELEQIRKDRYSPS